VASDETKTPKSITLDELIALNDEIAGLVRAGVPLEPALEELSRDMPGRLGQIAAAVAERSRRGESLDEVIAGQSSQWPPVYRAVVEAGLKAGRLPAALEALAGSIRRTAETRRNVAAAALYPLLVLAAAWGLFAFYAGSIAPQIRDMFVELELPGQGLLATICHLGTFAGIWGPAVPLLVFILAAAWWYWSGKAVIAQPNRAAAVLGWLPWMGRALRCSQAATVAEVLALLVESRVPLDEAFALAAEASGNRRTRSAADRAASAVARGESEAATVKDAGLPPLLSWLMSAGQQHGALAAALRHAAVTYRNRADHQANLARVFLPVILTVGLGGTATLINVLLVFAPYTSILTTPGIW